MLLSVQLFGDVTMGAKRWLDLGIVTVQPSEFIRLGMILALARFYQSIHQDVVSHFQNLFVPALSFWFRLPYYQPAGSWNDDYAGGERCWCSVSRRAKLAVFRRRCRGHCGDCSWCGNACSIIRKNACLFSLIRSATLWGGLSHYQSKIGIGSGGLFGKGFSEGTQSRLNFLPENTRFRVYHLCRRNGLCRQVLLLVLFVLLLVQLAFIANQMRSQFARLVVGGIGFSLFVYIFINLAMVMGLAPVVGVPLPFISYGGTSMLTFLLSIGVVLSLERQVRVEMSRG